MSRVWTRPVSLHEPCAGDSSLRGVRTVTLSYSPGGELFDPVPSPEPASPLPSLSSRRPAHKDRGAPDRGAPDRGAPRLRGHAPCPVSCNPAAASACSPATPPCTLPTERKENCVCPAERRVTLSDVPAATASPPRVPPSTVCSRCPLCPWRPFRAPRGSGCRCRPSSSNAEVAYVPPATPWLLGVFPEEKETLSS